MSKKNKMISLLVSATLLASVLPSYAFNNPSYVSDQERRNSALLKYKQEEFDGYKKDLAHLEKINEQWGKRIGDESDRWLWERVFEKKKLEIFLRINKATAFWERILPGR